ncbi:MAG: cytochrome c biosis protein [Pseudonocardiales bacterium]|jgi:cytochrome c biogenesis protein|nr:cytochrome c biosis protein [Pseudonocardiales bacterium]
MIRASTLTAALRNTWRGLTSMRTALMLLFLLALGALPGALLPQYSLNAERVRTYQAQHPKLAPVLDWLGFFEVFASPWFAAIYLLLFVSLVGCVVPRSIEYVRQLRRAPVATPRNLSRLPHHARSESDASTEEIIATARRRLRGWRIAEREEPGGARTLSAERGYVREAGNLVFHLALLGLLVSFAIGKLVGYQGQVIVLADGSQFCNSGPLAYDSFQPGRSVDGTTLAPFCLQANAFTPTYLPTGQAEEFRAAISYQGPDDLATGSWHPYQLKVNDPLRLGGTRVYLLGHGYAPQFTVTFPDGQQRRAVVQWRPVEQATFLSEGATKFDPPGVTDDATRRTRQLAITGLFAPTAAFRGSLLSSAFPDLLDPAVAIDVLKGDLGNNSGRGQSIFSIDQSMVDSGRLKQVARGNLRPGGQLTLPDRTVVHFDGVTRFVSLQVSYDPAQLWVLGFATLVLGGLALSLTVKRRRFWVRVTDRETLGAGLAGTVVELGGLARTEAAGYGEEFEQIAADLLPPGRGQPPVPAAVSKKGGRSDADQPGSGVLQ